MEPGKVPGRGKKVLGRRDASKWGQKGCRQGKVLGREGGRGCQTVGGGEYGCQEEQVGKVLGRREVPGKGRRVVPDRGRKGRCQAGQCQTGEEGKCRWREGREHGGMEGGARQGRGGVRGAGKRHQGQEEEVLGWGCEESGVGADIGKGGGEEGARKGEGDARWGPGDVPGKGSVPGKV